MPSTSTRNTPMPSNGGSRTGITYRKRASTERAAVACTFSFGTSQRCDAGSRDR